MSQSQVTDYLQRIPSTKVIRAQIAEHVHKAQALRQLLRLADREEKRRGGASK